MLESLVFSHAKIFSLFPYFFVACIERLITFIILAYALAKYIDCIIIQSCPCLPGAKNEIRTYKNIEICLSYVRIYCMQNIPSVNDGHINNYIMCVSGCFVRHNKQKLQVCRHLLCLSTN